MHSQQLDHARARRARGHAVRALALAAALAGVTACAEDSPSAPTATAKSATAAAVNALVTRVPKKFFVNPVTGSDANSGSSTAPFKTLAKALAVAISGDTVKLAAGKYSKATNGEKFSNAAQRVAPIRSGVRIEGTLNSSGLNATTLEGALGSSGPGTEIALDFMGSAVVTNVSLSQFDLGARANAGQQTLNHLALGSTSAGIRVEFSAQTTLQNSTVSVVGNAAIGVRVSDQARFTMDGGQLAGFASTCGSDSTSARGIVTTGAAQVTLKNKATLKDVPGVALDLNGTTNATLFNAVISKTNPFGCAPKPRVRMLDSSSLHLRQSTVVSASGGVGAIGIHSLTKGTLRIDTASVTGFTGAGVRAAPMRFRLVVNKGSILGNKVGIHAQDVTSGDASITISGSTLASNQTGIVAPFFKLRGSTVAGNTQGVVLSAPFADLGSAGDPGNNRFINNLLTGVTYRSTLVCCGVWATGNTWNALTQGADASGRYTPGLFVGGSSPLAHGSNFNLPNLNLSIQL